MIVFLLFLLFALLTFLNFSIYNDLLYPPVIAGFIWSVVFLTYFLFQSELFVLNVSTFMLILVGYLSFSLGGVFATRRQITFVPIRYEAKSADWIIWLSLLGLPFILYKLYVIGSNGPTDNPFFNLRYAFSVEDLDKLETRMGILNYFTPLAIFGCAIHLFDIVKTTRYKKWLIFTIAVVYAVISTGRTYYLLLFSLIGSGLVMQGKVRLRKILLVGFVTYISLFGLLGLLLSKTTGGGENPVREVLDSIKFYFLGGIAGLNAWGQDKGDLTLGAYTCRSIFAALHKVDSNFQVKSLVMEFRDVPFPTNVYTVARPYFQDFGWIGLILSQLAFGFLHSHAYLRARRREIVWLFVYCLMTFPLLLQFFMDCYMSLLSTWIQAMVLLWVVRSTTRGKVILE